MYKLLKLIFIVFGANEKLANLVLQQPEDVIKDEITRAFTKKRYSLTAHLIVALSHHSSQDVQTCVQQTITEVINKARLLVQSSDFSKALDFILQFIVFEPFKSNVAFLLMQLKCLENLGSIKKHQCLEVVNTLSRLVPQDESVKNKINHHIVQPLQAIAQHRQHKKYYEALALLEPFLKAESFSQKENICIAHADCLQGIGEYAQALAILKPLLSNPTSSNTREIRLLHDAVSNKIKNTQGIKRLTVIVDDNGSDRVQKLKSMSPVLPELENKKFILKLTRGLRSYLELYLSFLVFLALVIWVKSAEQHYIQVPSFIQNIPYGVLEVIALSLISLPIVSWLFYALIPNARPRYEIHIDAKGGDGFKSGMLYIQHGIFNTYREVVQLSEVLNVTLSRPFYYKLTGNSAIYLVFDNKNNIPIISPLNPHDCQMLQIKLNEWISKARNSVLNVS